MRPLRSLFYYDVRAGARAQYDAVFCPLFAATPLTPKVHRVMSWSKLPTGPRSCDLQDYLDEWGPSQRDERCLWRHEGLHCLRGKCLFLLENYQYLCSRMTKKKEKKRRKSCWENEKNIMPLLTLQWQIFLSSAERVWYIFHMRNADYISDCMRLQTEHSGTT